MTSSLVGSEMCIRDSLHCVDKQHRRCLKRADIWAGRVVDLSDRTDMQVGALLAHTSKIVPQWELASSITLPARFASALPRIGQAPIHLR
eukprot:12360335-Prorocentrum_lima.AAC.1